MRHPACQPRFRQKLGPALLSLAYRTAFARLTPTATATRPRTRLTTTFRIATQNAPARKLAKISHSNVENVEYAPINPIGTRNRHDGLTSTCRFSNSSDTPIIRHAEILTSRVP